MSDTQHEPRGDNVRVVLDATGLGTQGPAADDYVVELARAAGRARSPLVAVCKPRDAKLFKSFDIEVHRAPDRVTSERQRQWWVAWGLSRFARELGAHVIHSPQEVFPVAGAIRRVVAIHHPIDNPVRKLVRKATSSKIDVVVASETIAQEIRERTGAASNRVHVAHRGVDKAHAGIPDWDALSAFEETYGVTEWVAIVASSESVAALGAVCDGFRQATEFSERRPTLIITGVDEKRALAHASGLVAAGFDVRIIGEMPDDELPALLGGALVSVVLDDSFHTGKTLVTAMLCGATIVTLARPVFEEFAATAVEYAEASPASMEIAFAGLLNNPERRQQLATRAVTAGNVFTWDACLAAHEDVWARARARA